MSLQNDTSYNTAFVSGGRLLYGFALLLRDSLCHHSIRLQCIMGLSLANNAAKGMT